ncbi:EamA family transporter [archaeon]|nr:EamA family transporter [archaeon]
MFGFILAFIAAVSKATTDLFAKKGFEKTDEYVIVFALRFFSLPFLLLTLPFIKIPTLDSTFYLAAILSTLLNIGTTILYFKAIKISPLSLTIPFLSFSPVFLLIPSFFILGEFPGIYGLLGIFVIVFGAYMLNAKKAKDGLLAPIKALMNEKGSRYMLAVTFLYSLTTTLDKIAINHSSPMFYAFVFNLFLTIALFPVMLKFSNNHIHDIKLHKNALLPIGFFAALASIAQFLAISMILVVYVSAIKRTASLFSIAYGKYFFKEDNIKERLLGAIVMIMGVLAITLL